MNIKNMSIKELEKLCFDTRTQLIKVISNIGGHLGSNLGVVELSVALHFVFDSPNDIILFDVGHQSYVHKILTNRKSKLNTIRQKNGLAPFLDPSESIHDGFVTGHAGNILSAGYGLAVSNPDKKIIVVIGDAAFTNGQTLEAINDISGKCKNLFIVLNDNDMSIGESVGGIFNYLNKAILQNKSYKRIKQEIKTMLKKGKLARISKFGERVDRSFQYILSPTSNFFLELGFDYSGPINGHNLSDLIEVFKNLSQNNEKTSIVHIKTIKGKGYKFAENDKEKFHGVSPFEIETGELKKNRELTYSQVFGKKIVSIAKNNPNIIGISAAMVSGTGFFDFFEKFSERAYNVGISEEHAVTFAAGLAKGGKQPIVSIYSTFLQRGYDQLIHDVAISNLPVVFILDRAGIVGEDGKTHHGIFDISYFYTIPNFELYTPVCKRQFEEMLDFATSNPKNPIAIRIPRGGAYKKVDIGFDKKYKEIIKDEKNENIIFAVGSMVKEIFDLQKKLSNENISLTVVAVSNVKPFDEKYILKNVPKYKNIFTIEENVVNGGFGVHFLKFLNENNIFKKVNIFGIENKFISHGTRNELLEDEALSGESLFERIKRTIK